MFAYFVYFYIEKNPMQSAALCLGLKKVEVPFFIWESIGQLSRPSSSVPQSSVLHFYMKPQRVIFFNLLYYDNIKNNL